MPRPDDRHPELPVDPDPAQAPGMPAHRQWPVIGWVVLGGFFGAPACYGVAEALPSGPSGFPVATFVTNLAGAFMLGVLLETLVRRGDDRGTRRTLRLLLGTGFLGAFTTYSTLAVDTDLLVRSHRFLVAAGYAVGTVLIGAMCTVIGIGGASRHHRAGHERARRPQR